MRAYAFDQVSNRADLDLDWLVLGENSRAITWDLDDDVVRLALAFDDVRGGYDYGRRFKQSNNNPQAFFRASSDDGSNVVTLINPGWISIHVPAANMNVDPVELRVGLAYERKSTGTRSTLWVGRLPLIEGLA